MSDINNNQEIEKQLLMKINSTLRLEITLIKAKLLLEVEAFEKADKMLQKAEKLLNRQAQKSGQHNSRYLISEFDV